MAAYYPSLVCNLTIRFDDRLTLLPPPPQPVSVDDALQQGENAPGEVSLLFKRPLILQSGGQDSFVMNRIPKSCNVELPGYRQAAHFNAVFDYVDLPIDPRTIRAASMEIHLGTIEPDKFAEGMQQRSPSGHRSSILETGDETLVGTFFIDEWNVEHDADHSTISMEGRDFRGFLLDKPIAHNPAQALSLLGNVDFTEPIDRVVAQILSFSELFKSVTVSTNPAEWKDGKVPSPGDNDLMPRARVSARKGGGHGGGAPKISMPAGLESLNFWDLIVRMCFLVGAIPYFQGTNLVIRPTRSIFDQDRAGIDPNIPTPFAGGRERGVDFGVDPPVALFPPISVRRMVYGRDIKTINFNRKFAGYQKPYAVRCICLDTSSPEKGINKTVVGVYPDIHFKEARTTKVAPGGQGKPEENILNIPVPGIRDPERLKLIAQSVYEEIGRGELGGSVHTPNCASFAGDNSDPDMLKLRPGDGIEFLFDTRFNSIRTPAVSSVLDFQRTSFEDAVATMKKKIPDDNLCRVVVATSRGLVAELQRFFRVSTVKYNWDGKGVQIEFDFQNYVVARQQVEPAPVEKGAMKSIATVGRGGNDPVAAAKITTLTRELQQKIASLELPEVQVNGKTQQLAIVKVNPSAFDLALLSTQPKLKFTP